MREISHCLECVRRLAAGVTILAAAGGSAVAQQPSDTTSHRLTTHVMAQAIPLLTRASPTAEHRTLTEAYLSQPLVMIGADRGPLHLITTVNLEGLTLERGELTTGAHGEGYVDRRHPHAYLHELMAGGAAPVGPVVASLFAGRGFVPFGSDDPMMRPFEKYPANHHLAQVLERLVVVGAGRRGPLSVEVAAFGGDEPTSPSSQPTYSRFADSWAARLTWRPTMPLELSLSDATVVSPEVAAGGGLDQLKRSAVARWRESSTDRERYLFIEWARSTLRSTAGVQNGAYESWLGEGSICRNGPRAAVRLERTDRPEEERLADPFRSPVPPSDNSIHGVTRWTTTTVALSTSIRAGIVAVRPFVEIARARPKALFPGSVFQPDNFYGADVLWMMSVGAKLGVGQTHGRMGRYGAALPEQAHQPQTMMGHEMPHTVGLPMNMAIPRIDRCAE